MLARYDDYIVDEVMPLIRNECGDDAKPLVTGASLGAFLAANTYCKHADIFRGAIAMSGSYDIYSYLDKGYFDDNVYFNNPTMYLKNLDDNNHHLRNLQKGDSFVVVTGQGDYEAPHKSVEFSDLLNSKGIPHLLDMWGHDVAHDWVWWRKMLPYYLGRFCD